MEFPVFISVFYLSIIFAFISQILAKMTQDVEMKEQQPAPSNSLSSTSPSILQCKCSIFMCINPCNFFEGILFNYDMIGALHFGEETLTTMFILFRVVLNETQRKCHYIYDISLRL